MSAYSDYVEEWLDRLEETESKLRHPAFRDLVKDTYDEDLEPWTDE